jgi:hypothetical protein
MDLESGGGEVPFFLLFIPLSSFFFFYSLWKQKCNREEKMEKPFGRENRRVSWQRPSVWEVCALPLGNEDCVAAAWVLSFLSFLFLFFLFLLLSFLFSYYSFRLGGEIAEVGGTAVSMGMRLW